MDSHRTAHMAGQNYSKLIRQAVLFDYIKKPQYYDDGPPPDDMWRDWSDEFRGIEIGDERGAQSRL